MAGNPGQLRHACGASPRLTWLPTKGPDLDEAEIRALIERWVKAVHSGDMDGVLADHAADIVMFDVPPPENGMRGIAAYRATWPPCFKRQA